MFGAIHLPTLLDRCECIGWKCITPVHVLIAAKIQNKSPTCLFYKIENVVEAPAEESVSSHKL